MAFLRLCAWLLAATCAPGLWAAEERSVLRGPAPDWIEKHEVDLAASADASNEQRETTQFLLRDAQRHVGEAVVYTHIAYRLLTQEGVQAGASLTIEFDPAYEKLEFHQLAIHRDTQRLDRLAGQEIKVFQRETNLESQLYDGRLTASIILEGVRVGDVIEYAYSRRGANPLYAGHTLGDISTDRTKLLHQWRERLLCPADRPAPQFLGHATEVRAASRRIPGDLVEYRWEADDLPARLLESDVPSWIETLGWVQISDFQTWSEVAQWAAALFAPAIPDPAAPLPEELEKEAAVLQRMPAEADRVVAALRYVQDNFRYLGIEIGANSHRPYLVATVCERRFGDCKDKANLLSVLLRRLGFEASPALVSTDSRQAIATWLPTPWAFDHAIVRVSWKGRAYWLDPTRAYQGGTLEHVYLPAYGKALVIDPQTRDLSDIVPGGQDESAVEILNTLHHTSYADPAILHVRSTFRGAEADAMRATRATTSARQFERDCLNFYGRRYPQVTARQPVRFQDNLEGNELITEEEYEIPGAWEADPDDSSKLQLSLYAGSLSGRLLNPATRLRTKPFRVRFPSYARELFEVQLAHPPHITPQHVEINDPAFHFDFRSERAGALLRLSYEFTSRAPEVAAERTASYSVHIKHAREQLEYLLTRPNAAAEPAAATEAITPEYPAPTRQVWGVLFTLLLLGLMAVWIYRTAARLRPATLHESRPALHTCIVCHRTDGSHPDLEFRVAGDGRDYCADHLRRPTARTVP